MKAHHKTSVFVFLLATALLSFDDSAQAASRLITIDTTPFAGTSGLLVIDFLDGGPPSNSVLIAQLQTDGVFGTLIRTGDVVGDVPGPIQLTDATFFTEFTIGITLGSMLSFVLQDTANSAANDSFPDSLAVFLLDDTLVESLSLTSEPTGSNALLLLNVGASPDLELFQSEELTVTVSAVPLPAPLALVGLTLPMIFIWRRCTRGAPRYRYAM